jgi:hypothetical protein
MNDPIWFRWTGCFLPLTTLLLAWSLFFKRNRPPNFMLVLFVLTYAFTVWQARWAYFFVVVLAMSLPACLAAIEKRSLGWIIAILASFRFCKIGTRAFGLTNRRSRVSAKSELRRCSDASWQLACDRGRRNHSSLPGGSHLPLVIGRASLRSPEVRAKA